MSSYNLLNFFLLQSCFYRSRSALADDCWEGVVLSIFIDFQFRFSFGFFFTYGKHIFPIEFDWTSLAPFPPRHSLSFTHAARSLVCFIDIASLPLLLCFVLFPKKKNSNSGRRGDMFRHYVAITIDAQGVGETHVCLYDNLHIWPPTEWFVDRSIHTGD